MPHDARAIANALLDSADLKGVKITPLKLQKLIYFAHGLSLVTLKDGLIFNAFQAWDHGPVVKVVYDEFKDLGDQAIERRATWRNLLVEGLELAQVSLSVNEAECIARTVDLYGPVDAYTLSRLSHAPGGPWDVVRKAPAKYAKGIIPAELIRDFFGSYSMRKYNS